MHLAYRFVHPDAVKLLAEDDFIGGERYDNVNEGGPRSRRILNPVRLVCNVRKNLASSVGNGIAHHWEGVVRRQNLLLVSVILGVLELHMLWFFAHVMGRLRCGASVSSLDVIWSAVTGRMITQ